MSDHFVEEHGGAYWITYDIKAILQAMQQGSGYDEIR
jgi:hypothetical protein